jgi:hypothetical protein
VSDRYAGSEVASGLESAENDGGRGTDGLRRDGDDKDGLAGVGGVVRLCRNAVRRVEEVMLMGKGERSVAAVMRFSTRLRSVYASKERDELENRRKSRYGATVTCVHGRQAIDTSCKPSRAGVPSAPQAKYPRTDTRSDTTTHPHTKL